MILAMAGLDLDRINRTRQVQEFLEDVPYPATLIANWLGVVGNHNVYRISEVIRAHNGLAADCSSAYGCMHSTYDIAAEIVDLAPTLTPPTPEELAEEEELRSRPLSEIFGELLDRANDE